MIFKQIPTMISDLNKLGIALKSLDAMKIGTVGVNIANIEAYRTALKGLSVEQSVFALASKGATEEQIRQILIINEATAKDVEAAMAKAGLTTATKALTQAEMIEIATKNGVAKAEAEELLRKIGITATEEGQVAVKKQVTLAMLEQAVASGNLTAAESTQIATMLGLNAVETTNIGITNVLTASFAKLWAVITAHPIGAILTAIGAVAVGTIAYINKTNKDAKKALVEAHETAQQALEDTKTSLSDDKSELQSINSELETTKQKIQEISSIGAPTLVEQNELNKLSTTNAQLEIQRTLLENNIKLKQKSAALDAKELLGTQVEMEYADILDGSSIESHNESYSYKDHAKYQASNLKNAYNIYMKALREGDVKKQQLAQELIAASAGDSATLTSELLEIIESFKYEDGTIIEGYEKIYNEYMGLIYNLQSLTNPDTFLDIAKSVTSNTGIDYEKVISDAYKLAFEGNFDINKLNQDFVKALSDAGIDESTIDYIFSVKQQEYQLLVDKINEKYKVSETPDKIRQDYWDANGNIHSEYIDVDEETKRQIAEINTVNERLNEYAKENPIEFQLVSSFDENFETLDKYIEEERIKAENITDYIGDYITNAIKRICDEAKVQSSTFNFENPISLSISQTVDQLNTQLKPSFDALRSAYNDIFTDDGEFALNSIDILSTCDSIKSKLDELNETEGITVDFSAYEDFVRVLSDTESTEQDVEDAFDSLATSITQAGLSGAEDFDTMKAALEDLGVVNNELVAFSALASNTKALKETLDQANVSMDDFIVNTEDGSIKATEAGQAFIEEMVGAENCAEAINILAYNKELCNLQEMNTAKEVANLRTLAENAGYTGNIIKYLTELEQIYQEVANGTLTPAQIGIKLGRAAILKNMIDNAANKIQYAPKVDWSGAVKNAGKAGKEAGESFADAFKDELDNFMNVQEKALDAGKISFKEYCISVSSYIQEAYNSGKISAKDFWDYQGRFLEKQKSVYDKVVRAVTRKIDDELDKLKDKQDEIDKFYDSQISSLEATKKLLQETNDERKRQADLQKALYDMERAYNQRTVLQYSDEKGMHYVSDPKAIRDARENVASTRLEIQIAEIDKSISRLEELRDKEKSALEDIIEKLEDYKEKWNDVTSAYEEAQEDQLAAMILGQGWEADILSMRTETLTNFANDYIRLQQAIADAAWESANAQIAAQQAAMSAISNPSSTVPDKKETSDAKSPTKSPTKKYNSVAIGIKTAAAVSHVTNAFSKLLKFHTGLRQGLVGSHSFDDDFKLVQSVGLKENEVPAILKKGEAVATQEQISNIADGLRQSNNSESQTVVINGTEYRPLQPGDKMYDLVQKFDAYLERINHNIDMLTPNSVYEHQRQMEDMAKQINYVSSVTNNNRNTQPVVNHINVTCPGVTSQQVAEQLGSVIGKELDKQFNGFHNYTDQMSRIR